jgi:hypothetical protein
MAPWAKEFVTHYLDILDIHTHLKNTGIYDDNIARSKMFVGDINDGFGWGEVLAEEPFDFAICSQTLEDIRNPSYTLKTLPIIAKEGFISVPHKYRELSFVENYTLEHQGIFGLSKPYIGYLHHRWIFTVIEGYKFFDTQEGKIIQRNILRLFPKLEFVSCLKELTEKIKDKSVMNELTLWWKGDLPFEIINGDFLGPDTKSVFEMYTNKIEEGI